MFNLVHLSPYEHLFISMGLGLLVGLQREWALSTVAGIRSFTLVTILGTVSALLAEKYGEWVVGIIFFGALFLSFYVRKELSEKSVVHKGMVTELSILLMYCVGVMVKAGPTLVAASIAVLVSLILQVKIELHNFVSRFSGEEIRSIMQFMAISLLVFPLVPNQHFGPQGILNFHHIWWIVILITGIGLLGQIVTKFTPSGTGLLWTGILGGMISSTVTTLSYSKDSRTFQDNSFNNCLIILTAWLTVYVRIIIELYFVAPNFSILPSLLGMILVSIISVFWSWRKNHKKENTVLINYDPTGLKTALSFAFFYTMIIIIFSNLKENAKPEAISFLAFFSGIFDMDAITLSTGRMVQKGILSQQQGKTHIYLALIANLLSKGFITLIIGGKNLFLKVVYPWIISIFLALGILLYHIFKS